MLRFALLALLRLWPIWLWLFVRYATGIATVGTVYFHAAQTAAPLSLLAFSVGLSRLGVGSKGGVVLASIGACVSGGVGLYWEYLRWVPVLPVTPFGTIAANLNLPLVIASIACLSAPFAVAALRLFSAKNTAPSDLHGSASWMAIKDALEALSQGSLVVGEAYDPSRAPERGGKAPLLRFDGRGHLLTIAGSGSGKTVSVAIPNALSWEHNLVVHDPKGEIYRATAPTRRAAGRKVVHLDPDSSETYAINVLSWIDGSKDSAIENARAVASWLMPATEGKGDDYFRKSAMSLLEILILFVVTSPDLAAEQRDLIMVRQLALMPTLEGTLQRMVILGPNHAFGGLHRRATALLDLVNAEKQWAGITGELDSATDWLEIPTLARLVRAGAERGVQLSDLNTKKLDVFVSLPLKTLESAPQVARVLIGALLNAVYEDYHRRGASTRRTLFLIDEMPRLRKMELLEVARDAGRGLGVTLWCIVQDLGQLRAAYGEYGLTGWLESTQIRQFFGISDIETAERISKLLGTSTVAFQNTSVSTQGGSVFGLPSTSSSTSQQLQGRALMLPEEIIQMRTDGNGVPDEQIVFVRGMKPIRCGMAKYYRRNDVGIA